MNYFTGCKTLDEAKKKFRKLAMEFHPDKGGNASDFRELKQQFDNFKPEEEQASDKYFNAENFVSIIEQLILIDGIEIEVCGSWLWIKTEKKHKEQIKAIKLPENYILRWSKNKVRWYIRENYKFRKQSKNELSMEEIRAFYGSEEVKDKKAKSKSIYPVRITG